MVANKVFFKTPFNHDLDAESDASGLHCVDPSLAAQSEAEDADINTIVKRFGLLGTMPEAVRLPTYGDFVGVSDYHGALNAIIQADDSFMELPASVRSRFDNDPGLFVDFCSDPANREELVKLFGDSATKAAPSASVAAPAAAGGAEDKGAAAPASGAS